MLPSLLHIKAKAEEPRRAGEEWTADLDAAAVVETMAAGDTCIAGSVRNVLLCCRGTGVDDVLYRQAVVGDALACGGFFNRTYELLTKGLARYDEQFRSSQPSFSQFMPVVERIRWSSEMLRTLLDLASALRAEFLAGGGRCVSPGMGALRSAFLALFSDGFLEKASLRQRELAAITGDTPVVLGAKLGNGLKGIDYRIRGVGRREGRKQRGAGVIALDRVNLQLKAIELRDAALLNVLYAANAVNAQTAAAFKRLRSEFGFYVGCIRLHRRLVEIGVPVRFPTPRPGEDEIFCFSGLVDAGLALRTGEAPVPNGLALDGARLVLVTGANQGGKSTFLRSVGLAQAMLQSGLFVTAEEYVSGVGARIFTHFCRAEDGAMDSGKLDEELRRMDRIVDGIAPRDMLLMNESFASTTEREGALIAQEITRALHGLHVRALFVTHNYQYARSMEGAGLPGVVSVCAERNGDGSRSFRIRPGTASPRSHGMDLYRSIMETGRGADGL